MAPPLMAAIEKTSKKKLLTALRRTEHKDLDLAKASATDQLKKSESGSPVIIEQANKRRSQILDEAKAEAEQERTKIRMAPGAGGEARRKRAREGLRKPGCYPGWVAGAEKIIDVPWMKALQRHRG